MSSLVTRQLTHEEMELLVKGGSDIHNKAWQPADFFEADIANTPPIVAVSRRPSLSADALFN